MKFLRKYRIVLVFTIAGLAAGFFYWKFIGCNSGSCPITSNWHSSVALGGLFGFLLSDIAKDAFAGKKKEEGE